MWKTKQLKKLHGAERELFRPVAVVFSRAKRLYVQRPDPDRGEGLMKVKRWEESWAPTAAGPAKDVVAVGGRQQLMMCAHAHGVPRENTAAAVDHMQRVARHAASRAKMRAAKENRPLGLDVALPFHLRRVVGEGSGPVLGNTPFHRLERSIDGGRREPSS